MLSCHHSSWGLAIWYSRQSRQTASNCLSVYLSVCLSVLLPIIRKGSPAVYCQAIDRQYLQEMVHQQPHLHYSIATLFKPQVTSTPKAFNVRNITSINSAVKGSERLRGLCGRELPSSNAGSSDRLQWSMFFVVSVLVDKWLLDTQIKTQSPSAQSF